MSDVLMIYQFSKEKKLSNWHIVNDEVMGGVSMGLVQLNKEGKGVFSGHVSLEHNGGFCLVRYDMDRIDVSKFSSFEIRLKGDGKKYQFRCKSGEHQRHSYIYHFTSSKEWKTITIPFSKMEPFFRGDALKMPNYHGDFLTQIGILIGNNKEEDFNLELDYIQLK
ncbi:CIA30 family protein [Maribacter sp. MAR_2009_72]|uniref:CIA30 family protein n=1 Tax=Maribacter sp. MAR_2009_72 TaxID=1250050 RepID=UPI00119ACBAE|nr:CIA30 family protein [Maribacter sp. MAR_2009_72]TVZ14667.1 complex I intermediate-associated protein 30 (CIA30) [Maribacter sp. MAR_2009_72]